MGHFSFRDRIETLWFCMECNLEADDEYNQYSNEAEDYCCRSMFVLVMMRTQSCQKFHAIQKADGLFFNS